MNKQISNSIMASLVADAYVLGAHWVYDEKQLQDLPINWETLNDPQAMWHKSKTKGDLTHYGDQTLFLLEYITKNKEFSKNDFYSFWKDKMSSYDGYIDASTRESLEKMNSASNDLSICGRLAPLLISANNKDVFLSRVKELVEMTHNSKLAYQSSQFFAEILWDSLKNEDITKSIQITKEKYPELSDWVDEGFNSRNSDTFSTIREFGPACGIDGGFAGVIHLLSLKDDFKTIMQKNAKAGGDSSARGMVVAMILGSQDGVSITQDWVNGINNIEKIRSYLI